MDTKIVRKKTANALQMGQDERISSKKKKEKKRKAHEGTPQPPQRRYAGGYGSRLKTANEPPRTKTKKKHGTPREKEAGNRPHTQPTTRIGTRLKTLPRHRPRRNDPTPTRRKHYQPPATERGSAVRQTAGKRKAARNENPPAKNSGSREDEPLFRNPGRGGKKTNGSEMDTSGDPSRVKGRRKPGGGERP